MTARRASFIGFLLLLVVAGGWYATRRGPASTGPASVPAQQLIATLRGDPTTFNSYRSPGFPTHLVALLTQAPLVRINRATGEVEPWLADRWTTSPDRRVYRLHLRDGLAFSDGHPFTADDVVFSLKAAYDPRGGVALRGALTIDGQPIGARALDPRDVELTFPAPYGPGLRVLDTLPIYPRHLLEASFEAGTFAQAWNTSTPAGQMAGLGPFRFAGYEPGQRVLLTRNPHYWRHDAAGRQLPYLDRLTLAVVQDQNTELLRLRAGEADLLQNELRPEDYLPLREDERRGRVRVQDAGTSLDLTAFWINLTPAARAERGRAWLRRDEFRQAVTCAVDRRQFARSVYLGAADPAWSIVSPANREWYDTTVAGPAFDQARARQLLAAAGLRDRDGDGRLDDERGPARFSLLVQRGVTASEKGAAVLRESLAALGITVDIVALDFGAVMTRWEHGDYDAIYHLIQATDTDPAGNLDFWLSSGDAHMWNPAAAQPSTDWERQVDALMQRQAAAVDHAERVRLFGDVQRVFAEHVPMIVFAVPHVYVASSTRVSGATLSVQRPQVLWNADMLAVTR